MENTMKLKIALALVGFGIAMKLFIFLNSLLGYYGASPWIYSSYYFWPSAMEWLGQMSIILGFLIFASLILEKSRLQRIVQVSLVIAIVLGFVGNMGIDWLYYNLFSNGQNFDENVLIALSIASHLGATLTFLGVALIFYSVASVKVTSQLIK